LTARRGGRQPKAALPWRAGSGIRADADRRMIHPRDVTEDTMFNPRRIF